MGIDNEIPLRGMGDAPLDDMETLRVEGAAFALAVDTAHEQSRDPLGDRLSRDTATGDPVRKIVDASGLRMRTRRLGDFR